MEKKPNQLFFFGVGSAQKNPNSTERVCVVVDGDFDVFAHDLIDGEIVELVSDIELLRASKINEIRNECGDKIRAGIQTDVIHGYSVHYRLNEHDMERINDAAGDPGGGLIWRNEILEHHSQNDAITLKGLARAHKDNQTIKWAGKYTYLLDSTRTNAEIKSVTWDSVE